jgi:hypothetical protein
LSLELNLVIIILLDKKVLRIGYFRFVQYMVTCPYFDSRMCTCILISVAEPHHFYAAPAPDKNFDTAPAPALAPAPTLCIARQTFKNELKFRHMLKLSCSNDSVRENMN